jgi:hypothetical protein
MSEIPQDTTPTLMNELNWEEGRGEQFIFAFKWLRATQVHNSDTPQCVLNEFNVQ